MNLRTSSVVVLPGRSGGFVTGTACDACSQKVMMGITTLERLRMNDYSLSDKSEVT